MIIPLVWYPWELPGGCPVPIVQSTCATGFLVMRYVNGAQGPASSDYAKYMRNVKAHREMGKHAIFSFAVPIVPTKSASISRAKRYNYHVIF